MRRIVPLLRRLVLGTLTITVAATAAVTDPAPPNEAVHGAPGTTIAVGATLEALARDAARTSVAAPHTEGAPCAADRLEVRWSLPSGYTAGAHIEPLGPAPTDETHAVNGVVLCGGTDAYMGFEAIRSGGDWAVHPTPDVDAHDEHIADPDAHVLEPEEVEPHAPDEPTAPVVRPPVEPGLGTAKGDGTIEPYAAYDPQTTCSAGAKPGVLDFRNRLLTTYPGSRSLGISRGCSVGGRSEHKEGRALDWGVRVDRPAERAAAEDVLAWLLATDDDGNTHANARRLGVMYIVWNRQIWGAYRAEAGWRPYHGSSPHTDHIHFSFAWPGARAQTSYWTGEAAEMPSGGDWRSAGGEVRRVGAKRSRERWSDEEREEWRAAREARKKEWLAEREARRAEREARKKEWMAEREARKKEWMAEREARRAEREARKQEWLAEREARKAEWRAQREARRQEWRDRQRSRPGERRGGQRGSSGSHQPRPDPTPAPAPAEVSPQT